MTVARSVGDVLAEHVRFEVECTIDIHITETIDQARLLPKAA
jgi:hypothetical protein